VITDPDMGVSLDQNNEKDVLYGKPKTSFVVFRDFA
jgi:hypothetical protein